MRSENMKNLTKNIKKLNKLLKKAKVNEIDNITTININIKIIDNNIIDLTNSIISYYDIL